MTDLKNKKCVPCEGGVQPFNAQEIQNYTNDLSEGWEVLEDKKLRRTFPFNNFVEGMAFVQKAAEIAEEEQHHPDMCIHYSSVDVEFTTHAIGGLSENDFIMAAKYDQI
jgi:4a-hydroxytetrahydrobiopterin dehydratase